MSKSAKNQVREILRAQGIWDEPKPEAVTALSKLLTEAYSSGSDDAEYDAQMAENFRH